VDDDGGWTIVIPPGTDGDATVVEKDDQGKTSPPITIPVDVVPPETPGTAHQDKTDDGVNVVTNDPDDPNGKSDPGDTIVVTWPDGSTSETVVDDDGNWAIEIPPGTNGPATVVEKDDQGNTSPPITVPVDVIPPNEPGAQQDRDEDGNPILTNPNDPDLQVDPGDEVYVTWPSVDGEPPVTDGPITVDEDGNWSVPIPPGVDGPVTVVVVDPSGNVSPPFTVPVDVVAPDAPSSAYEDGKYVTNNPADPNGKSDPGDTIVITWPDGSTSETTVEADGSWIVEIPTKGDGSAMDGDATVVEIDPSGNVSPGVSVDIVPPMYLLDEELVVTTTQDTAVYLPVLELVGGGRESTAKSLLSYTMPTNGAILLMDGTVTRNGVLDLGTTDIMHNPAAGFVGEDVFTVTVSDGHGHIIQVPVRVVVLAAPQVKTGGDIVSTFGLNLAVGACAIAGMAMLMVVLVAKRRRRAE
jgi:hypothetical protein